ncbi:MAG: Ig domain-containing protein, partial [Blastocatellia bacterium]
MTINCQAISVTPTTLSNGTTGANFSQLLSQTGGVNTITWSVSAGNLPPGLSLNPTSGGLSGIPTAAGIFNFTARATDVNNCFGEQTYSLTIDCQSLSLSPASLNPAMIVTSYSQQLTLTGGGGATTWTVTSGALPSGITLNQTSGLLSGLPNVPGTFNFTIKATINSTGCFGQQAYTLVITCPTITVDPPTISNGNLGVPYSQQFTQIGGAVGNSTWTISSGSLPNNMTLSAMGLLSGAPTMSGSYPITVRVTDGNTCFGERGYTLVIGNCPTINITPNNLPSGLLNAAYNQALTASGGTPNYTFAVTGGALPGGVSLSSAGVLSGSPTVVGSYNFTVTATDQAGCTGTKNYTLVICPTITVNPATLPNGTVGSAYNQILSAAGGFGSHSFSFSGTLPTGLTLDSAGVLSGSPSATGIFNFTVTAMDTNSCIGTRAYTVVISGTGLQFYPLARPVRLLDTRPGASACIAPGTQIPGATSLTVPARGTCDGLNIPANAAAVTGNVTTVLSGGGYLTIYPSDVAQPLAANSNFAANQVLNNVFTVGLGAADGAFKIFVTSNTDVVVDITGYYAPPGAGGLFFHPLPAPVRLL